MLKINERFDWGRLYEDYHKTHMIRKNFKQIARINRDPQVQDEKDYEFILGGEKDYTF